MNKINRLIILLLVQTCLVVPGKLSAQCTGINFSTNKPNTCLNEVITFTSSNVPALTSYTWQLGLDTIKGVDLDTLRFGYIKTGTYSVTLFLKFKNGDTCSVRKKKYIHVNPIPAVPTIAISDSVMCNINETVTVTNKSPGIESWTWNIGQVLYKDTVNSITHKFITAGFFNVDLTVKDKNGCENSARFDSALLVEKRPVLTSGFATRSVCDTYSLFPKPKFNLFGQTGYTYQWKFPGGTPSAFNVKFPNKIDYTTSGNYLFELNMKSKYGCSYDYQFNDTLKIGKSAKFTVQTTSEAPCNTQAFDLKIQNTSAISGKVSWYFKGDSVTASTTNTSAKVKYVSDGSYNYVIEHNDNGCISSQTGVINATIHTLKANFDLDHGCNCNFPDTLLLTDKSQIEFNTGIGYEWTVTDSKNKIAASSKAQNPKLILNYFDKYTVNLKVTDANGCIDTLEKNNIFLLLRNKPKLSASPDHACAGTNIQFSIDSACLYKTKSVQWFFYNSKSVLVGTANGMNPTFSFTSIGKYSAAMVFENWNGCRDSVYEKDIVSIENIQSINYTLSDLFPCEGSALNATLKILPAEITPKVTWQLINPTKKIVLTAKAVSGQKNEFLFKIDKSGVYNMRLVVDGGSTCKDSVVKSSVVKVSAIDASFKPDATIGCLPFSTVLKSSVIRNEHYKNPTDNSISYSWKISPDASTKLLTPNKSTTTVQIKEPGAYAVFLTVVNSDGCENTYFEQNIFSFDFESVFTVDTSNCQGIVIQPKNLTNGTGNTYNWYTNTSSIDFKSKNTAKQPYLSFTNPGYYNLYLESISKSGCRDTSFRKIHIHPFSYSFSVLNATPKCTPAQYIFNTAKSNVDTFTWLFGDASSVVTTSLGLGHIYDLSKVRPFRNFFDVSLIGSNSLGCIDTLIKTDFIHVLGPNPTFGIENPIGCEPHQVNFQDSTDQVVKFYFNYGDGSPFDSISYVNHIYKKADTTRAVEIYQPYIIASDKNKCFVSYIPYDSISLFSNPIPRFSVEKTKGCAPFSINFHNRSKFAIKQFWDFNNDGVVDDTTKNPSIVLDVGVYTVKLVVENSNGCRDSIIKKQYITSFSRPSAIFTMSDTILCPNKPILFDNQSSGRYTIKTNKWYFSDSNGVDSTQSKSPNHTFMKQGIYSVKLIVIDENGCTDTAFKKNRITIVDSLPVLFPQISYVTVDENKGVNLFWKAALRTGFTENRIIRENDFANPNWILVDPKTTYRQIADTEVVDKSISYQIQLIDRCGVSRLSTPHKTIFLTVTKKEKPYAILNWTPYTLWDSMDFYLIYRAGKGEAFKQIAKVKSTDTSFVDFQVCDNEYVYLISTVHPVEGYITYSNSVKFIPYYDRPKDMLQIDLVTVKDGQILVKWKQNAELGIKNYFVDRYESHTDWIAELYNTTDTFIVDTMTEPSLFSYQYRVRFIDFCSKSSPASNIGTSIHLDAEMEDNGKLTYTWNPYFEWAEGVDHYILQTSSDRNFPISTFKEFGADQLSFVENNRLLRIDSAFSARLVAIRKMAESDSSFSNWVDIKPLPNVFIPNAFTPNNDGLNDSFAYGGIGFMKEYGSQCTMAIYSRWGEQVFYSEKFGDFWDGRHNGVICQPDVFRYILRITGRNRISYSYIGNVEIIR